MEAELRKACAEICAPARIEAAIEMIWYSPPILFDKDCVAAVKQAAGAAGYGNMEIVSGAGHDACYVSRSEEHTSELQSLMRISYAVFCLKQKNKKQQSA